MEKSISNSSDLNFYFDYNATSPLASSVQQAFSSGEFYFANPSSQHRWGKKSKKYLIDTEDFLFDFFKLEPEKFDLVFHSGATEGINHFFKVSAENDFFQQKKSLFVMLETDHSAVVQQATMLERLNHRVLFIKCNRTGEIQEESWENFLQLQYNFEQVYFNVSLINNETGFVFSLEKYQKLTKLPQVYLHIDAAQLPFKLENWQVLPDHFKMITFSGHKFGALFGTGFSFIQKNFLDRALITGGGQQSNLRSGTINIQGVVSLKLAMEEKLLEIQATRNSKSGEQNCREIRDKIWDMLAKKYPQIQLVSSKEHLNTNTICTVFPAGFNADFVLMKFDLAGVSVSNGSACSSGIAKINRILKAQGFSDQEASSGIRFSFNPSMSKEQGELYLEKIDQILASLFL